MRAPREFSEEEWRMLTPACDELRRAAAPGSMWRSYGADTKAVMVAPDDQAPLVPQWAVRDSDESYRDGMAPLNVTHWTKTYAKKVADLDGDGHIRSMSGAKIAGLRKWREVTGLVYAPASSANPERYSAIAFAELPGPLGHLLIAYALESFDAWLKVEPYLHCACPSRAELFAGRDAMARLMYRTAATSIKDRAKQLRVRRSTYQAMTYEIEHRLMAWVLSASRAFSERFHYASSPVGASQGNSLLARGWWSEAQAAELGFRSLGRRRRNP